MPIPNRSKICCMNNLQNIQQFLFWKNLCLIFGQIRSPTEIPLFERSEFRDFLIFLLLFVSIQKVKG
jgi:hypothetical protein